jgi:hypothetical protein
MLLSRLLLAALIFHVTANPRTASVQEGEAGSLALEFQKTVLELTKDTSLDRSGAIDLYWKSSQMSSGSRDTLERSLGELYTQLKGHQGGRATLTSSGWQVEPPVSPIILTRGMRFDNFFLIITNQTEQRREFTINSGDPALQATPVFLSLAPGSSSGRFIPLNTQREGVFQTELRIESEHVSAPLRLKCDVRLTGRLLVHINDGEGHPTGARIFLTAADGYSHWPQASVDRVMWRSGEHFFYADGAIEIDLPAGNARIEALKGFDYEPLVSLISIIPGRTTTVDLRLKHIQKMNNRGWYSGDGHIHGNYIGDQFVTPHDDFLVIRAEDLNVGNMVVSNSTGGVIHDEQYFEGQPNQLSSKRHILYWNQEMRTYGLYGHLLFYNLRQLVRPLDTGFPGSPNWEDYPSNYAQAMKAKAQGAFTAYAHPALAFDRIPTGSLAGESVVDVALGAIDAFEVFCSHDEPSMALWYKFLNSGFRLGITAGSDAFVNQRFALVTGGVRVYVHTGRQFDYQSWINNLSQGRAFATVGPLLFFEIEGKLPGEEFHFVRGPVKLKAKASVSSLVPMTKLEIVANGKVVHSVSTDTPTNKLQWHGTIDLPHSAWLAARVWGPDHRLIANSPSRWAESRSSLVLLAHTGASYVHIGNGPIYSPEDQEFFIQWIDTLIEMVKKQGKFSDERKREEVIETFLRARRVYETRKVEAALPNH